MWGRGLNRAVYILMIQALAWFRKCLRLMREMENNFENVGIDVRIVQLGEYQRTLIPNSGTSKYKIYVILPL